METKELLELKENLDNGLLTVAQVFEKLKNAVKPWKTEEWKSKKEKTIKKFCEVCGTNEGVLNLLNHDLPPTFSDIRINLINDIKIHIAQDVFDSLNLEDFKNQIQSEKRLACPACRFLTFRERKTMLPKYKCAKNHEFDLPIEVDYYPLARTTDLDEAIGFAKNGELNKQLNKLIAEEYQAITKFALSESLNYSIQYMTLENTSTVCKKCLFIERKDTIEMKALNISEITKKLFIQLYDN